ncbi:CTR copper uptake transporter [Suillus subalutaceus]|uniref:CTR copper uptake transporter n=1 Tax=Suillus subalutaceus TaxID=48586 RepID=UPI001B861A2D|nr:CTR copper uptake transporter [Suillus subalutaceus]KAG1847158.1 CTR copper uptake transporter [Suillus subalutaceus]
MNWESFALCLLCLSQVCLAYNGMDMPMDDGMTLAVGNMLSYLHFTPVDTRGLYLLNCIQGALLTGQYTVWFLGWVPQSSGAMVGTCIALFMLALIERWIAACRGVMDSHWGQQAIIIASDKLNTLPTQSSPIGFIKRFTPPFIPAHDITRGIMFAAQTLLGYLFMLTVMTYQLGFIFSLVVGLGVGETLFGRFSGIAYAH